VAWRTTEPGDGHSTAESRLRLRIVGHRDRSIPANLRCRARLVPEWFHASSADAWAITDTTQFGHHLQSYFFGFPGRSLRERPLRRFWREIRVEATKDDVIWRNEIGMSSLLRRERFAWDVAVPSARIVSNGKNPTIFGWRALLDRGVPFVKRELLRRPEVAPDGDQVRLELRRRFGVDVDEWI